MTSLAIKPLNEFRTRGLQTDVRKNFIEESFRTASCVSGWYVNEIEITYPNSMRINSNSNVKVKWIPTPRGFAETE